MLAFMSFVAGLLLDIVTLGRRELKRLHYLALRGRRTWSVERPTRSSTSERNGWRAQVTSQPWAVS